jgi:hypothetical protein
MVNVLWIISTLAVICIGRSIAHPGEFHDAEDIRREIAKRDVLASQWKRSLETCSSSADALTLQERAINRRAATVHKLRELLGLTKSTLQKYL